MKSYKPLDLLILFLGEEDIVRTSGFDNENESENGKSSDVDVSWRPGW